MSAEVKILVEGSTNADSVGETGEEKTRPTITLVRDENIVMVVDPGVLESQQILTDALANENLTVNDVNVVCITHSHIDHYRNIGMFPKAKTLEYFGLWDKESVENWHENFSSHIQVLRTPGHDYTCITLFVKTDSGTVAICGDVFWRESYPEDDKYATDVIKLRESRKIVMKMADWIIPGHGPMFKKKKNLDETGIKIPVAKKAALKNGYVCKKCHRPIKKEERCLCRPWLCHNCCECGFDCEVCGCSHNKHVV